MRISKATREAAIIRALLEAEAFRRRALLEAEAFRRRDLSGEESPILANPDAQRLLADAYEAVWKTIGYDGDIADDALEAAALLEDGWSPGDPVERIG